MINNQDILFSIVIPTYNRAGMIGTAIESVLSQTYTNWELIVVDDGSTDNTKEIVESYQDKRIRYFWKENEELNAARNTGVELSKGDFICFLDDDDYYLKRHLELLNDSIVEYDNRIGVFKSGLLMLLKKKHIKLEAYSIKKHKNPINYILFGDTNLLPLAFHKDIFNSYQFNHDCLLFDDHNFLLKVLLKFPLFETNNYTVVYVKHDKARTKLYFREKGKLDNLFNCVDELFNSQGDQIKKFTHRKIREELNSTFYISFAHKAIENNNFRLAIYYLFKANLLYFNLNILNRTFIALLRLIYRVIKKNK